MLFWRVSLSFLHLKNRRYCPNLLVNAGLHICVYDSKVWECVDMLGKASLPSRARFLTSSVSLIVGFTIKNPSYSLKKHYTHFTSQTLKSNAKKALHVFCGCSTYLSPRWTADTEVSFSTSFLEETESQNINSGFNRSWHHFLGNLPE